MLWTWRALFDHSGLPYRDGTPPLDGPVAVFVFSDGLVTNGQDVSGVRVDGKRAAFEATRNICGLFRDQPNVELYTAFYSDEDKGLFERGRSFMSDCAGREDRSWSTPNVAALASVFEKFGDAIINQDRLSARITK